MVNKAKITELCKIAYKYQTDKCPQIKHPYTPYYYELLNPIRHKVKKVLEMGIGGPEQMIEVEDYKTGASLRMWQEFFPNALIYGADIHRSLMFEDKRIKTIVCDSTKKHHIHKMMRQVGSDVDLFVDDGSHVWQHQAFLAKTMLPLLDKDVIYIIEDVHFQEPIIKELKGYECHIPNLQVGKMYYKSRGKYKIPKSRLLIIKNK